MLRMVGCWMMHPLKKIGTCKKLLEVDIATSSRAGE